MCYYFNFLLLMLLFVQPKETYSHFCNFVLQSELSSWDPLLSSHQTHLTKSHQTTKQYFDQRAGPPER